MKTYFIQFGSGDPRTLGGMSATFLIFKTSDGSNITPPGISEIPTSSGIHYFNWGTTTPIAFLADAATTSPGAAARYVAGALDPADRSDEYGTTLVAIGTSHIAQGVSIIAQGVTNIALGTSNVALGTSNIAQGNTLFGFGVSNIALGTSNAAIGSTIYGYGVSIYALGISIYALGLSTVINIGTTASSFGSTSTDPSDLFGYMKRVLENLEGNNTFIKSSGELDIYSRGSSTLLRVKTVTNSVSTVIKT